MTSPKTSHKGYSLIEMIVTIGIFSLAFTAITTIFLSYSTAQSRAGSSQRLLNEGNYMLEAMTREIRMNSIDYACGWDPALTFDTICLRGFDGQYIRFQYVTATKILYVCKDYDVSKCALGSTTGSWARLGPASVEISSLEFRVYPTVNPNSSTVTQANAWQPMTTILMTIAAGKGKARQTYDLQTAASSRVYGL